MRLPCTGGLWLPPPEDDGENHGKGNPPNNVVKMMEDEGQNGVLISGVISWIETERHSGAAGIWKQVAKQCWSPEEVKEARKQIMLLMSSKQVDDLKEKEKKFNKDRQTTQDPTVRMMKEIEDIAIILEFLKTSQKMPLILATTCQIRQSPKSIGSVEPNASMGDVLTKMASMESCMAKFMDSSMKQMETLTEAVRDQKVTEPNVYKSVNAKTGSTPGKKKPEVEGDNSTKEGEIEEEEIIINEKESYASKTMAGITPLKRSQSVSKSQGSSQTNQLLKNVLIKMVESNSKQNEKNTEKPKRPLMFHGKATTSTDETVTEASLAADVDLVAFGVAKTAEPEHLEKFLKDRGVNVEKVECLTKLELIQENKVKSKTMKVTVKASEHEKAMNPDVWPQRVGVRYYKAPSRRPGQEEGGGQGAEGGGLQARSQDSGQEAYRGRPRQSQNRRNKFEQVDGWNVPRNSRSNSPITIEKLQEMLRNANQHP